MKKQSTKLERSSTPPPQDPQGAATSDAILGTRGESAPFSPPVDPKWKPYQRALLALREQLLSGRVRHRQEGGGESGVGHTHLADSGAAEFDQDLALSELSASQNALFEVEEALRRLADGTYGVCEETGKPIAQERLRAIPWTRFSREAELRREKNQAHGRALGPLESTRGPAK